MAALTAAGTKAAGTFSGDGRCSLVSDYAAVASLQLPLCINSAFHKKVNATNQKPMKNGYTAMRSGAYSFGQTRC